MKLARTAAAALLLAALAACGTSPTGPVEAPDAPLYEEGTQHGSGG